MNHVVNVSASANLPTQFDPGHSAKKQAQADAIIEYAQRIKEWPLLEGAVAAKIEEQAEFVRWWDENVVAVAGPGRGKKAVSRPVTALSADDAERLTGFDKMRVSRIRKRLSDPEKYRLMLYGAAWAKAFPDLAETLAIKHGGDEESYTPVCYLNSARAVMGGIDLDPASNSMAQANVQAETYYTVDDDGLSQEWAGRVWMNPPYTARVINEFIAKLVMHYEAGDVSAAIALTNNNTDTSWFHLAAVSASAICLTAGRINFLKRDGSTSSPTNGQSFFYFGSDVDAFKREFCHHGLVMVKA